MDERQRMMQIYRNEAAMSGGLQLGGAYCTRQVKPRKTRACLNYAEGPKPKGAKASNARLYVKKNGEFVTLASQEKARPKKKVT